MMNNRLVKESIANVIKKNISIIGLLVFVVGGAVILSLIPPQILKNIIDNSLVPRKRDGLRTLAVAYMAVLLLIGIFDFMKEAVLTVLGQKITKEIRLKMMEKLEKINAVFFSANESGTVVSRFTNDVDAVSSMFTGGIVGMIIDCFKIIGIVVSIWVFSGKL